MVSVAPEQIVRRALSACGCTSGLGLRERCRPNDSKRPAADNADGIANPAATAAPFLSRSLRENGVFTRQKVRGWPVQSNFYDILENPASQSEINNSTGIAPASQAVPRPRA